VHLIEVQEDEKEVKCLTIYNHPSEIWSLSPCPSDPDLFFTCYNANNGSTPQFKSSLWKMQAGSSTLQHVVELKGHIGTIKRYCARPLVTNVNESVTWSPAETGVSDTVVSLDENNIRYWKLESSAAKVY
jgi:hypothetical protein